MSWIGSLDWVVGFASTGVELIGAVAGTTRWRRNGPGQRMIACWFVAAGAIDIAVLWTGLNGHNNQPLIRLWYLASVVLSLMALSCFQHSGRRVVALRAAIAGYAVIWFLLLLTIEPAKGFATYSSPLQTVVILGAALTTLQRRASIGRGELLVDPGFLIAAGLAGYAIADVFEMVVAPLWVHDFVDGILAYNIMSNILTALAEVVIIRALFVAPAASRQNAS